MSDAFSHETDSNFSIWWEKKCFECQCPKEGSLFPSQLFLFPAIVLTVFENDAAKGKTRDTIEYKLSKPIIQNHYYGTYTVLPIWWTTVSTVHALYGPLWMG